MPADGSRVLLPEDAYGHAKRQVYVDDIITRHKPGSVLDFGCGTGSQLTRPLAVAHPDVEFVGVDSDEVSLSFARNQPTLKNLRYCQMEDVDPERRFDMVIASEVIEHVDKPDELLAMLYRRLTPNGRLVLTVPNGYGPFETMSFIEHVFTLTGVLPLMRMVKHAIFGKPRRDDSAVLTLAVSPHLNFFSLSEMRELFRNAGFEVVDLRPRTLFCGFIIEWAIRGPLIAWNADVADRLPAWCASDWMFDCVKAKTAPAPAQPWRRGWWARFRRYLSEARWAGVSLQSH